ncbi:triglyceride lipase-cholesterol esterase [Schizosaccharomyces japonicus yFS275]|uniref:Triglyceride lipase-cholesterol esterase n=1 Tax=Schizosaccharomyces japonicus (strain yFS275 / FY16936) TaxID=402676 RepID=B6JXL8_SCHJY|nr:triglyceride lipase-cholesterol esterase [Schizosaccharomyces japonicus yFS275]EEB05162.1 triglyceride lipase-cholesterol esterase [Schizosaccharomyces japonicus yFS275]
MHLPFPVLRRLYLYEYTALVLGFALVVFESFVASLAFVINSLVVKVFPKWSVWNKKTALQAYAVDDIETIDKAFSLHDAKSIREMCEVHGFGVEEHLIRTNDDYILCVHRIYQMTDNALNGPGKPKSRPVVYCHHGLLMNSEVWVCNLDANKCLVFDLVRRGYDVWLGNNRGNKYSRQHLYLRSSDVDFWDFCIDDFAQYDIPDTIHYILNVTEQPSLSYVGFSQGTAQAFASLSIHPLLNEKVNTFIALAPAISPRGLHSSVGDAIVRANPFLLYMFFGHKSFLASAGFWQSILYPPLFDVVLNYCLVHLFDWRCKNMTPLQKLVSYAHLYSYTSVKCLVHWFQIMHSGEFRMYDNDMLIQSTYAPYYKAARFPTKNIRTPIHLLWGDCDSLVDINVMLNVLPEGTQEVRVDSYEHLDMIWSDTVDVDVNPHVFQWLEQAKRG